MKRNGIQLVRRASFLAAIVAVFMAMVLAVIVRETLAMVGGAEAAGAPTPVAAAEVTEREFADTITAVGTARANEAVTVTSKIADVVSRIGFDSGDFVESGQVLVELVDTEEAATLAEARAALSEARQARSRVAELLERGVATAQRRDEAESDFQRAAAQVNAVEARIADRLIRAPIDGTVGLRNITAGEQIDTGTVIATLNDVSIIKLDFELPERFLSAIALDQAVQARASAYPGQVFEGRVASIDNQVDPVSRTVTIRAEMPNDDLRMVPGMLMRVEVRREVRDRAAIPESALMLLAEQSYVYVLTEDEDGWTAQERAVTPGLRTDGHVEILEGLEPGERVVSQGTHRTRDGAAVRLAEDSPGSGEADAAAADEAEAAQ